MRRLLILLFLWPGLIMSAATFYISPSGSDSNPGSITQPFFSLNKAWSVVSAGDIIYMRGGTYRYTSRQDITNKNGTSGSHINILNYSGENPVFDYSSATSVYIGLYIKNADYIHIKGLRITNVIQPANPTSGVYGMILWDDVDNSTFEMVEVDHIEGTGVGNAGSSSNNTFLNCDSHHNADPHPGGDGNPYGGSDGFWSASETATNILFKGCRAWFNSDDGWDLRRANGVYTIDNCWAFKNGFIPGTTNAAGNGDGYKLGGKSTPATNSILRTIRNSLAFENRATGFTPEPDASDLILGVDMYNCTSYKNARDLGEGINTGNYNNYTRVRNCISYANYGTNAWMQGGSVHDHNSWDMSKTVTDADFVSVSSSGVDGPRQSDGSMPNLGFLHLVAGSDLIDAGCDVGLSCTNAPDLGAFELTGTTAPDPAFVSAAIENTTPSNLDMTYSLSMANIIPSVSSFTVMVNSVSRSVNSVSISGTNVRLSLPNPVVYGDVVTVAYSKPSSNPLQTSSGGQAASTGAMTVTNKVNAVNPVYVNSTVANVTPSLLEMTYNLTLANIVPPSSSFTVLVNSTARAVNSVSVSGTKVQLNLASPIVFGNVVTVAYSKPSSNAIQTSSGGQAITMSAQTVINNVGAVNPVYVSSSISNATPSLLEMSYNLTLANISPSSSSFTVMVNSVVRTVNSVVISGSKVQLALSSPVVYGNVVTVAYTKPSSNPLQTAAGAQAVAMSAQPVTNNVASASLVYVSSQVANAAPLLLVITYNLSLANIIPAAQSFIVRVNSINRPVTSVSISGTKVQLALSSRIVAGDIITVSYTKPAINPVQTSSGVSAVTISNQPVTNNCINIAPVASITYPVANASFAALSDIIINATASDADGSIKLVEFFNGTVRLGSLTSAPFSFTWNDVPSGNYSLTAVATDNLNVKTVSSAVSVTVTNGNHGNRHPFIKISNPLKGNTYDNLSTITIDAVASDPDGTVTMVEFYNGQTKLAALTEAPYTFTWKDVPVGNYILTAIATDNLNDTTSSAPVNFIVGTPVIYDAGSDHVKLYPNPNNGHFSIEFVNPIKNAKSDIIITDLSGKQVYNGSVLKEELSKEFDLSEIRSGIYVMIIKDKEILVTKKFIKK